jgi:hypothetical protein
LVLVALVLAALVLAEREQPVPPAGPGLREPVYVALVPQVPVVLVALVPAAWASREVFVAQPVWRALRI